MSSILEEISDGWEYVQRRIAIVGSTDLTKQQYEDAKHLVEMILSKAARSHKTFGVVSGGAKGIDTLAQVTADFGWGLETAIIKPTVRRWWGEGGFQQRNVRVATECTELYRIATRDTKTYGSGWTADYAEKELGKRVYRYYV